MRAPRSEQSPPKATKRPEVLHPHAAGIDIGATHHYVAVPPDSTDQPVRSLGCFTADYQALADWLHACGVDTVAMESTGVYWIPLFQILESRGFDVYRVNARHVKNVPGRKTDVSDCQWLQQLHSFGLLSASFRPDEEICVLRSYWRHRDMRVGYAASHVQPMQKALEPMNLQLHKVLSDITGTTGMRIIRAILAGERDSVRLAALKDPRVRSSKERIAKALEGDYRREHLFALQQAVTLYDTYRQQIAQCDGQIEDYLSGLEDRVDVEAQPLPDKKNARKKPQGNPPAFDLRTHLYRISGVDFTQIEGLEVLNVQTILSEIGLDPSRFPTVKHFTSWMGICPHPRITGGQVKSSHTRKVKNRAATAFRLAAQSVANSQGPLGGFYRRMRARLGAPKAITATAHKIARIFYQLWKNPACYDPTRTEHDEQQNQQRTLNYLRKKARSLGFQLVPEPVAAQ